MDVVDEVFDWATKWGAADLSESEQVLRKGGVDEVGKRNLDRMHSIISSQELLQYPGTLIYELA